MKNIIKNQPKEIQVILSCICRKRQSDFMSKTLDEKRKKSDYENIVHFDRKFIEELTEAIEKLNGGKLLTTYGRENLTF